MQTLDFAPQLVLTQNHKMFARQAGSHVGDDEPYEESFIAPSDNESHVGDGDGDGEASLMHGRVGFDDVVAYIEFQLRKKQVPEKREAWARAAKAEYEKLAADMQLLASEALPQFTHAFTKMSNLAHSARVVSDSSKGRVRQGAVCAGCRTPEKWSNKRLDLIGNFNCAQLCRSVDMVSTFTDFKRHYYDADDAVEFDRGSFYLGKTCLAKFTASFLAKTFVVDLLMEIQYHVENYKGVLTDHELATGSFDEHGRFTTSALQEHPRAFVSFLDRREQITSAIASKKPPELPLYVENVIFGAVDAGRVGYTGRQLYERGLANINYCDQNPRHNDEERPSDAGDESCDSEDEPVMRRKGKRQGKGKQRARSPPKKRSRAVGGDTDDDDDDDDDTDESSLSAVEAPAGAKEGPPSARTRHAARGEPSSYTGPPAPPPPPPPRPEARTRPNIASVQTLASLSRADGALASRREIIAQLHHLAGRLQTSDQNEDAAIAAAGAFVASELFKELQEARVR